MARPRKRARGSARSGTARTGSFSKATSSASGRDRHGIRRASPFRGSSASLRPEISARAGKAAVQSGVQVRDPEAAVAVRLPEPGVRLWARPRRGTSRRSSGPETTLEPLGYHEARFGVCDRLAEAGTGTGVPPSDGLEWQPRHPGFRRQLSLGRHRRRPVDAGDSRCSSPCPADAGFPRTCRGGRGQTRRRLGSQA